MDNSTEGTTAIKSLPDEMLHFVGKVFDAAYQFQQVRCGDMTLGEAYTVFSNLQFIRRATAKLEKSVNLILDAQLTKAIDDRR